MSVFEIYTLKLQFIGMICSIGAIMCSIVAIFVTLKNLKEIREQFFQQNRGMLFFYINKMSDDVHHWTILKNFGNAPAELISLEISPKLDFKKTGNNDVEGIEEIEESIISNAKNVFLAPGQHIKSMFDFRKYKETSLDIELKYKTCGKKFIERYKIDLQYEDYVVSLKPNPDEKIGYLKYIHEEIKGLNDKFL